MASHPEFILQILSDPGILERLIPSEPGNASSIRSIREATDTQLAGGQPAADKAALALLRGALLYAQDALDESHRIAQEDSSGTGSYLHGMIHRREGDFDNARYWFRRAGRLGFFDALHAEAARVSTDMAKQSSWDPYLFTGLCERDKFGDRKHRAELVTLQRLEFRAYLDSVREKIAGV